ncbi:hypothetical protein [Qipengyuania sp. NPDC077563]|uniref:hypothetical protein n=1 Tax=Qipengyuania sp. NPDC077563 TaxID=3364497 RepID=UPI00012839A5
MTQEERELRHELRNAEQDKLALKKMLNRAADEIDELADADCSQVSIEHARSQAKRLRKVSGLKKK